jgi:hypothetical protein
MTMAIEKRRIEHTLVDTRNVRARLCHRWEPQKKYTGILRRHHRLQYSATTNTPVALLLPPLGPIPSNENLPQDANSTTNPSKDAPLKHEKSTRIRFYSKVRVVHIPSRLHYPEPMRKCLWGSLQEISENARRNSFEFAAEGWNWRSATEDDDMHVTKTGERIHPAHIVQEGQEGSLSHQVAV